MRWMCRSVQLAPPCEIPSSSPVCSFLTRGASRRPSRSRCTVIEPSKPKGKLHVLGNRGKKDAKPLLRIDELAPGLRTDEMIGAEVRSSDDRIVGEVRNIVFGTKDGRDYAVVASGGFFTAGKNSIVVPIRSLMVSQDRASFYLPITKEVMKKVPLVPDQDYKWLSDQKWRTENDALFKTR